MTPQSQSKETVFISYAHESVAFRADVKALADWLALNGIMIVSDHQHEIMPPDVGWPTWMLQEIEDAAVVLMVCSPLYKARFEKREEPPKGKGVVWEGAIITQDLYDSRGRNTKFFPILPSGGDYDNIPTVLRPFHNNHCFPSGNMGILALIHRAFEKRAASGTAVAGPTSSYPTSASVPATAKSVPQASPTLPGIWNVPHRRNLNFTGREELLDQLEQGLASGQAAALTALAGLGGVGKTQTALEYVYQHVTAYQVIWWIRSEEPAALAADYAALANECNLPEQDAPEQEIIVAAVRRWLESNGGWLLVFDNVPKKEDIVPYLPRGNTGHVIITSRSQAWRGVAAYLPVEIWKREESKAFLAKGTGRDDPDGADAIAQALGDLPLALAQAAAYMDETATSYADYLKLFQTRHGELWVGEHHPENYSETVATTWTLSMEEAAKAALGAAELMNLCAFLAPDDIPRDMLRNGREDVPEPLRGVLGDELQMNQVVAALRRFSLLEVRDDAFDMHRLVQAVVHDRLDDESRKTWCAAAMRVVNAAYPDDSKDVTTWSDCASLTPHARAVAAHAETMGVAQAEAARLLNQVGMYLLGRAELGEARNFFERALKIDEAAYGPDHPNVATDINNLGGTLWELGDRTGARACFERALKIDEAVYGPDHLNVAIDVNNLGPVLKDLGDLAGARAHFERALKIDEAVLGPDHPNVAIRVNNLGGVLRELGDLVGARVHHERTLGIMERVCGPNHPNVATAANNLGVVLQDLRDFAGALVLYERALRIDEAAFGPNHPNVATDVNNLGLVLKDLGDLAGARAYYERALTIFRASLDESHPKTVLVAKNLAALGK